MRHLIVLSGCGVLLLLLWGPSAPETNAQTRFGAPSSPAITAEIQRPRSEDVPKTRAPAQAASASWSEKIAYLKSRGTLVRAWDFTTADQLGTLKSGNVGITPGSGGTVPELDRTMAAYPGGGSLKFTVRGHSSANASGEWYGNFSPDLKKRFAANSEFWIQWKERKNAAMMDASPMQKDGGQIGIKTLILGHQDGAGAADSGTNIAASSRDMKLVVTSFGSKDPDLRFPVMYRYGPQAGGPTAGLTGEQRGRYSFQPGYPSGFGSCLYPGPYGSSNCFMWQADVWDTMTLRVKLGSYDDKAYPAPVFANSEVQLYITRPGKPRTLVLDWNPSTPGYVPLRAHPSWQYGKLWFGPYMTNKNPQQDHADMILWVADVIIATEPIPD